MNTIDQIDFMITKSIFKLFDNKISKNISHFFGLVPYEIYVIPGMYLAILQIIWLGTPDPIQFHLLPHWFSYSIFQFLKKSIKRPRPGCKYKELSKYIESSHCTKGHELQSFPSGHTGVAFSLATALFMEMNYSKLSHFFEISIKKDSTKKIISSIGLFVASMIGLHRISKGYHSFIDVVTGAILGSLIGMFSWLIMEHYKQLYDKLCEKNDKQKECENYNYEKTGKQLDYWLKNWTLDGYHTVKNDNVNNIIKIGRFILSLPILFLSVKFFTKDIFHLTNIKH
jgi:membrane-associated phospholipid phosphatase